MHTCMYTQPVNQSTIRGQQSHRQPAAVDTSFSFDLSGDEQGGGEQGGNWSEGWKKRIEGDDWEKNKNDKQAEYEAKRRGFNK